MVCNNKIDPIDKGCFIIIKIEVRIMFVAIRIDKISRNSLLKY